MGRSISILVSSTQRRGAEVFGEQLATALRSAGWETAFHALKAHGPGAGVAAEPLREASAATSGLRPGLVLSVRRLVHELDPGIVLAGGGATLKYAATALMAMRGRPALVYSSIGEPEYWANNPARRLMMSSLLRRADLVTAVSEATAGQLVGGFSVARSKVKVVHPGVPEAFLEISRKAGRTGLRVLFVGSISPEKDPHAAVDAVGAMGEPATLRFVGDGPMIGELRRIAQHNGGIEVVGSVADVKPHLEWADVLVLTSRTEGLPGVILEAAAAGLPVVSYDVGGVAEAVADGRTGFVHPRGDVAAMAASLAVLARDPGLRESMGAAAREKIREHFLMDQAVARFVAVLETLAHR